MSRLYIVHIMLSTETHQKARHSGGRWDGPNKCHGQQGAGQALRLAALRSRDNTTEPNATQQAPVAGVCPCVAGLPTLPNTETRAKRGRRNVPEHAGSLRQG